MKDENREKLQALLDEEVSGPLGDKIMNMVDDIVADERGDAHHEGMNYERDHPDAENDVWD